MKEFSDTAYAFHDMMANELMQATTRNTAGVRNQSITDGIFRWFDSDGYFSTSFMTNFEATDTDTQEWMLSVLRRTMEHGYLEYTALHMWRLTDAGLAVRTWEKL